MSESLKKALGSIPGLGMVAVVLTVLFTLADKKPTSPPKEKGSLNSAVATSETKPGPGQSSEKQEGYLEFLIEKKILIRVAAPKDADVLPGLIKPLTPVPTGENRRQPRRNGSHSGRVMSTC